LCSSLYYLGDYPPRLGLETEIWIKKKIFKWVGLKFVSDSKQNSTQYQRMGGNSLRLNLNGFLVTGHSVALGTQLQGQSETSVIVRGVDEQNKSMPKKKNGYKYFNTNKQILV
jgi:hypothetical protein